MGPKKRRCRPPLTLKDGGREVPFFFVKFRKGHVACHCASFCKDPCQFEEM